MRKLQSQGVHHITLVGADRQTSIDFWEGVLGMPFVFEQPNLDNAVGEPPLLRPGRRAADHDLHERGAEARPDAHLDRPRLRPPRRVRGLAGDLPAGGRAARRARDQHSGVKDRGFMDSIYFEDPLGLLIELASYRFEPPAGYTHAEVLLEAHKLRVERGDYNIAQVHLADAIEALVRAIAGVALGRPIAEGSRTARDPGGEHGRQHAEHPEAERQQPDRPDLRPRRRARLRGAGRVGQEGRRRSSWRRTRPT